IAVWQRIITDLPPSFFTPQAYHFSAVCYRRMGKYEKAIELYQVVVDNWPNFQYAWVAHFRIAECYEKLESLGRIPTEDAAVQIRHACQQILTNYPDCMGVGAARNLLKRWSPENSK
ncbi:MAG: hypothetical protein AMJ75_09695, partial [Phycisphaerae bacterium SM1_79]